MAFRCGVAFAAGARFSVGLRFVSEDEDLKYRTADNGNVIAIKDGEVVGGAGASVGPDKIPSFEFFSASEEQKGEGFTKRVRQYVETYVRDKVEALRHPKGMPDDCERIVMGPKQIRELAAHMNSDKAKALPYIAEVYRKGTFRNVPDEKHPRDFSGVIYTTAEVPINGETYRVELVSKKRIKTLDAEGSHYIQYGLSRADVVEDASPFYELLEVRVS